MTLSGDYELQIFLDTLILSFGLKTMSKLLLGIDIGTTSVKAVIINPHKDSIEGQASANTEATIPQLSNRNEQNVSQIFHTLDTVLESLPKQLMKNVAYIGVSGQMHGVVLWTKGWNWEEDNDENFSINDNGQISNLVTWQDSRCTPEFLATLPKSYRDSTNVGSVHTGFGIPTLFWMQQFEPEKLKSFQNSGTIHDFLVTILTNRTKKPLMTPQNAGSWGYFNSATRNWNLDDLEAANFPVHLLPEIVEAGSLAGTLHSSWHGVPAGCKIGAALGDLQSSIYSTLFDKPEKGSAFLNMSTSAQLAFITSGDELPLKIGQLKAAANGIDVLEYFDQHYIIVAAALTGGNCLSMFVQMLQTWVQDLGLHIDKDTIWSKIMSTDDDTQSSSDLVVIPTFLGERNCPAKRASVTNIHSGNLTLHQLSQAICRGIIANIEELMPQRVLLQNEIQTVYGTGSALIRNKILQNELAKIFNHVKVEICNSGADSAFGAATVGKRWID